MKKMFLCVVVAIITCALIFGCQKKVTKEQEPVKKPTHVVGPPVPPIK